MSQPELFSNPREAIKLENKNLHPGLLASVMAIGILDVTSHLIVVNPLISQLLFILSVLMLRVRDPRSCWMASRHHFLLGPY